MLRIARAADGSPLVGDENGFVPAGSVSSDVREYPDLLAAAARERIDSKALDRATSSRVPHDHCSFDVPLADPGKLWGIGLNYVDHAADLDEDAPEEPASFLKPQTTLTGPGGPIRLPPSEITDRVTAEAELGIVIGRECRDVSPDRVDEVVAGLVPVIDMTAEDVLQRNPRFLTRAKSFDTFLVLGPWLRVDRETDLDDVEVRTIVNDEVVARNTVGNMVFPPDELVAFHSRVMTLEPGDVISTGTPGAHAISAGDSVRAAVDGVGTVGANVVGSD